MGTRSDYYVGRDPETMEWLGSDGYDGYPEGVFEETGKDGHITPKFVVDEGTWRVEVNHYLSSQQSCTWPEEGWPWPWNDSNTTDYAYTYDDGQIWGSCFGSPWCLLVNGALPASEDEDGDEINADYWYAPKHDMPDMSERKNVRMDAGSGLITIGIDPSGGIAVGGNEPVHNRGGVRYDKAEPPAVGMGTADMGDMVLMSAIVMEVCSWDQREQSTAQALYRIRDLLGVFD